MRGAAFLMKCAYKALGSSSSQCFASAFLLEKNAMWTHTLEMGFVLKTSRALRKEF